MTRGGLCGRCGGARKGVRARSASPITTCARCRVPLCADHSRWDTAAGQDVCVRCARKHGLPVIKRVA